MLSFVSRSSALPATQPWQGGRHYRWTVLAIGVAVQGRHADRAGTQRHFVMGPALRVLQAVAVQRLRRQRDLAYELITAIPGVSCVKPSAALYMFPRLDPAMYPIQDDQQFINELLQETKVLLVQGSGFNWPSPDHFRIVFLPHEDDLREAISRIARFLDNYRKRHAQ